MEKIYRSRAPLRISFAGGGTDVPPYPELFGGAVISTTIDRYAYVTIKKNNQKGIRIISQDYNLLEKLGTVSNLKFKGKTSLIKTALAHAGLRKENIDVIIHSDSPPGSGLGSSSALAVSLIGCIARYRGKNYSTNTFAKQAIELERNLVGIKGGLQDQFASAYGGFNFIEFGKTVKVYPIKLKKSIRHELLASLILVNTGTVRLSGKILEKQIERYRQREHSTLHHLKVIKKLAYDVRKSLEKGEITKIGKMMNNYWEHKKQLVNNITTKKIDEIYNLGMKNGALGGKILGAGGGGHMMFLCDPDKRHKIVKAINKTNAKIVNFNFDISGLQTWVIQNKRVKNE